MGTAAGEGVNVGTLRLCSVCAFKLDKNMEQEIVGDVARVLLEFLVGLNNESSDDCQEQTGLETF